MTLIIMHDIDGIKMNQRAKIHLSSKLLYGHRHTPDRLLYPDH